VVGSKEPACCSIAVLTPTGGRRLFKKKFKKRHIKAQVGQAAEEMAVVAAAVEVLLAD
jgi:hypothetical protein